MKKIFLPYYVSRGILSALIAYVVFGASWLALLAAIALFALFSLYLHSGWFRVDPSQPLTPLRRDERARALQRKSLIAAIVIGLLLYIFLPLLNPRLGVSILPGPVSLSLGVLTYFVTQFFLLAKS